MSDEFTGIFDNLTPGDFDRETSAIDTSVLDTGTLGDTFNTWLQPLIDITWQKALQDDHLDAFAVLASDNTQRIFSSDADETVDHWAARLHREAVNMQATWFFLAMTSPARSFQDGDDVAHISPTTEQIEAALDAGVLDLAVCWVAVRDDSAGSEKLAGMIRLNEMGLPLDMVRGEFTADNPFAGVLGGDRAV